MEKRIIFIEIGPELTSDEVYRLSKDLEKVRPETTFVILPKGQNITIIKDLRNLIREVIKEMTKEDWNW